MIEIIDVKEKQKDRKYLFPPQGHLALIFLKNYSSLSDARLIENLSGNIEWQFLCGIFLGFNRLDKYKIVSQILCEFAFKLNNEKTEKVIYKYWDPYIAEPEKIVVDVSCYESEVRYPTDVKLLWSMCRVVSPKNDKGLSTSFYCQIAYEVFKMGEALCQLQ